MPGQTDRRRFPIHPEHVRAALDPRLADGTVARLLACERLHDRLDAALGLDSSIGDGAERQAIEAHAWLLGDPAEVARRAGALLHGQAIRAVLSGPEVVALVGAIGRDAHAIGLRAGALSPPRAHDGDLAAAIVHDGQVCLGEWLKEQPAALRERALLALQPATAPERQYPAFSRDEAMSVMAQVARSYEPAASDASHG